MELVNNIYRKASYGLSAKKNLFCWLMLLFTLLTVIPAAAQDLLWVKSAGGSGNDYGNSIAVDDNGNSYVTGYFRNTATFGTGETNETILVSAGLSDFFLAKYAPDGTLIWAKRAGGSGIDISQGIVVDGDGNSLLIGYFNGTATFGAGETNETILVSVGSFDIFLAKFAPDGTLIWAKRAGGTDGDTARDITLDSNGNSLITGSYFVSATFGVGETNETILNTGNFANIFLAKYAPDGSLIWVKSANASLINSYALAVDSEDNILVSSYFRGSATFGNGEVNETTLSSAGVQNIALAKYAPDGTLIWAKRDGVSSGNYATSNAIAVDSDGNSTITGNIYNGSVTFGAGEANETTLSNAGQADIFLAKYAPTEP
ncbi:MAG: SBBP repeat-containing protein [Calditrichae bacterium]|nr:SBBP repeat-containing protein [Calditrichia bacterium]